LHSWQGLTFAPDAAPDPPQVGQGHRHLATQDRHPEWDLHDDLDRLHRRRLLAAAEDGGEQVAQAAQAPEPAEVELLEAHLARAAATPLLEPATAERAELAHGVVLLALLGIAQDGIGFRDLLEALGRGLVTGVGVGVILLGEPPIGLLELGLLHLLGDAEHLVVILHRGHRLRLALRRDEHVHARRTQ
jgi:hypothetical protein